MNFTPAVIPEGLPREPDNYFCVVEGHFQGQRGSLTFFFAPKDWALIELWKRTGIPVEAVLRGIDAGFAKPRAGRKRFEQVNSLAFCRPWVLKEWEKVKA